ncbi:MAG: hypothetical protein K0S70_829 [Microbacterium sp.]|jgi:hypothetical protein|nr:hypothetical protein [Microbacterium sp.]
MSECTQCRDWGKEERHEDHAPRSTEASGHNFRWRHPNSRVSWTYETPEQARKYAPHWDKPVLEQSPDDGATWTEVICRHCGEGLWPGEPMVGPWMHAHGFYLCRHLTDTVAEPDSGSTVPDAAVPVHTDGDS